MGSAWLLGGKRTPIGRFLGDFANLPAPQLAGFCLKETVQSTGLNPSDIGEILVGQVLTAGVGQAPARQALNAAGLPDSIGAVTINKVCGSGLFAAMLAARSIQAGFYKAALAGGMESMSQAPHLLRQSRGGWKYGSQPLLDAIEVDGLRCARKQNLMGHYAECVATQHSIGRSDQDAWSLLSHQRAVAAQQQGAFEAEIAPVTVSDSLKVALDAGPRADSSLEKLNRLKAAFDTAGTVTAGNASTLSDGAASVLVVGDEIRQQLSHLTAFRIVAMSVHSHKPEDLFIAPVGAINKILDTAKLSASDIDLYEINEAFASQTIACIEGLELDRSKVNIHGGAIALGHPIGCSGARILVTLMHALVRHQKRYGIAALCLGGGEAVAMLIERS
ncbi:MAG: Acetyl-CoA acetyltransferase [Planctomycetota bacterium]|jgi:acetyl-CoA C-acetyltransferase